MLHTHDAWLKLHQILHCHAGHPRIPKLHRICTVVCAIHNSGAACIHACICYTCTDLFGIITAVPAGMELAMGDGDSEAGALTLGTGNYEMTVGSAGGRKVLGSREFALYYKQRHRAVDTRQSVTVNTMLARCALMGSLNPQS